MTIIPACKHVLTQLQDSLTCIANDEYSTPVSALNGSTIGQHVRHTIEFFKCLQESYHTGKIDYDTRERKTLLESDKNEGLKEIGDLLVWLQPNLLDKKLLLAVNYDLEGTSSSFIQSSSTRELVYNIEHAIHHMALIKVGLKEVCPHIQVDPSFGVAVSTLRHQREMEINQG